MTPASVDIHAWYGLPLKDLSTLTINGTLSYQACDDKLCFSPQSVPLSWTVAVKPLDRERAKP